MEPWWWSITFDQMYNKWWQDNKQHMKPFKRERLQHFLWIVIEEFNSFVKDPYRLDYQGVFEWFQTLWIYYRGPLSRKHITTALKRMMMPMGAGGMKRRIVWRGRQGLVHDNFCFLVCLEKADVKCNPIKSIRKDKAGLKKVTYEIEQLQNDLLVKVAKCALYQEKLSIKILPCVAIWVKSLIIDYKGFNNAFVVHFVQSLC